MGEYTVSKTHARGAGQEGLGRINEVAKFLGVSRTTVYQMMRNGDLPCVRLPGQRAGTEMRRIPWPAVRALVERCLSAGAGEGGARAS
jgi:excisionase family DNA binding protein